MMQKSTATPETVRASRKEPRIERIKRIIEETIMNEKDKELLLKDLCARLPYDVKIQVYYEDIAGSGYFDETVWLIDNDEPFHVNDRWIENIKPYLRPMSSMTGEERRTYDILACDFDGISMANSVDWLHAHHFDYRGLIERGLAIEAPNGMYK